MITWGRNRFGAVSGWRFIGALWSETGIFTTVTLTAAGVVYVTVSPQRLASMVTSKHLTASVAHKRLSVSVTTKE